jgi:release factor glutamine methyltransferase
VNAAATTLGEVLARTTEYLAARGCESPRLDAELLLARALELARIDLYMQLDRTLSEAELERARALVARRADREPIQYILGEWGFRRLTLTVDSRALIPRPETEVVVERCLRLLDGTTAPRVLDVGTGSGAIALALADEHPGARVTGIDTSAEALGLAQENTVRTGLGVTLRRHDLYTGLPGGPWDLVVSNPPYVLLSQFAELSPEVRDWEPEAALVEAGATESIARSAPGVLERGGSLVLEVADGTAESVATLLDEVGFHSIRVTQDLAGRPRVVEGMTNGSRAKPGDRGSRGPR